MEDDYVTNMLKGGDKIHCITTLLQMFKALVQQVSDARNDASIEDDSTIVATSANQQQNSILDELSLVEEHLVFKFSMMDPGIKCLEMLALVNVNRVSAVLITSIIMVLEILCQCLVWR